MYGMDETLNVPDIQVSLTDVAPSIASEVMMMKAIEEYVKECEKEYTEAHLEYATGNSPIKDSMGNLVSAMAKLSAAEEFKKDIDRAKVPSEEQEKIGKEIIYKIRQASINDLDFIINHYSNKVGYPKIEKVEWEHLYAIIIDFGDNGGFVEYIPKDAKGEQMIKDQKLDKLNE